MSTPRDRVLSIIAGVIRQAVQDARAERILLAEGDTPEAKLAVECCNAAIGAGRVRTISDAEVRARVPGLTSTLSHEVEVKPGTDADEGVLTAHPANKTALLIGAARPRELLLPIGDLYASQVNALAGGWSLPPGAARLVDSCGGIEALDAALSAWFDERRTAETVTAGLPQKARGPFLEAVRASRFWRNRAGLVPKLAARTIGVE